MLLPRHRLPFTQRFERVAPARKDALRQFLALEPLVELTEAEAQLARGLSVWRVFVVEVGRDDSVAHKELVA